MHKKCTHTNTQPQPHTVHMNVTLFLNVKTFFFCVTYSKTSSAGLYFLYRNKQLWCVSFIRLHWKINRPSTSLSLCCGCLHVTTLYCIINLFSTTLVMLMLCRHFCISFINRESFPKSSIPTKKIPARTSDPSSTWGREFHSRGEYPPPSFFIIHSFMYSSEKKSRRKAKRKINHQRNVSPMLLKHLIILQRV